MKIFIERKDARFPWIDAIMRQLRLEGWLASSRTACSGGAYIMKIANQQSHLSWSLVLPYPWAMLRFLGTRP